MQLSDIYIKTQTLYNYLHWLALTDSLCTTITHTDWTNVDNTLYNNYSHWLDKT